MYTGIKNSILIAIHEYLIKYSHGYIRILSFKNITLYYYLHKLTFDFCLFLFFKNLVQKFKFIKKNIKCTILIYLSLRDINLFKKMNINFIEIR